MASLPKELSVGTVRMMTSQTSVLVKKYKKKTKKKKNSRGTSTPSSYEDQPSARGQDLTAGTTGKAGHT